jgi:hypothetical protein
MSPTREELCAYIDGELEPVQMARVGALVESSPELKQYVRNQERLLENLHAAFAPMMNEAVPERLVRAVSETPLSIRATLKEWLAKRAAPRSGALLRFAVPTAALVVGLFIGVGVERPFGTPDFVTSSGTGQIVAQAGLARALGEELASAPAATGPRIGMTFRSKGGDICRTFEVSGAASTTDGIACHRGGEWQIGALVNGAKQTRSTGYELAGASTPAAIRAAVSADMSGLPFDATAERQARDSGWK